MAKKKTTTKKKATTATLQRHIKKVLTDAAKAQPEKKPYLTAYQILELLPTRVRNGLIKKHGKGGKLSGFPNAATKRVANAAEHVTKDVVHLGIIVRPESKVRSSGTKIRFEIQGSWLEPSGDTCGLYRLPPNPRRKRSRAGTP